MMADLPLDILFTIFSKLPIKSLMRFKCISKQWCRIISRDPCFAAMQMNNQNLEDARILLLLGHFYESSEKHGEDDGGLFFKINLNRLEKGDRSKKEYYHLQNSCNGLLFFTKNFEDKEVVLCNPLTQEAAALPCPKPWFPAPTLVNYGFGFDSLFGKYKILRIFSQRGEDGNSNNWINVAAEVSSLEGSGISWREIENFPSQPFQRPIIYAGGALHYASTDEFSGSLILVSFLLDKEEFISTPFPDLFCIKLVEMGGLLGIVDLSWRSKIEIWVQKELRGEWIKEYKIDITAPGGLPDHCRAEVIGIWKNDKVLLSYYPNSFVSYDKESDTFKFIELPTMKWDARIITHRGSLVSVPRFSLNKEGS